MNDINLYDCGYFTVWGYFPPAGCSLGYLPSGPILVHHRFQVGDFVRCTDPSDSQIRLVDGRVYKVSGLSGWHGLDCVYLEGEPQRRQLADRFELYVPPELPSVCKKKGML